MTETAEKTPFSELHWNQLRRWATAHDIIVYGKSREVVEAECMAACPDFQMEKDAPVPTKYLKADQHTRDATQILDQDGNKLCIVFRQGREIDGKRATLPMEENVKKIVDALKKIDA
jgi:hypothetical protein